MNYRVRVYTQNAPNKHRLVIVSRSHANNFANALHFQVIVKFGSQLLERFSKVYSVRIYMLEEKVTALCFIKNLVHWPIEKLFNKIKSRFRSLFEEILIYAPVLKLYLEHLWVVFLLLVHEATISNKVYHEVKSKGIAIDKNFIVLFLQHVSAREEGLKSASLDLTQS